MILMFLGFFAYIGGEYRIISLGAIVVGVACEFLGFFLAYLGYKSATPTQSRAEPFSLRPAFQHSLVTSFLIPVTLSTLLSNSPSSGHYER
jgi:hypothetical protein